VEEWIDVSSSALPIITTIESSREQQQATTTTFDFATRIVLDRLDRVLRTSAHHQCGFGFAQHTPLHTIARIVPLHLVQVVLALLQQ
jgi:hypothetical protein